MFKIHLGIPEMREFWDSLSMNPRHSGLHTHDIEALTKRYKMKVWESYLENNKPAAGRIFWVYGPDQSDITIIGLEPHPNSDKKDAYKKITLSAFDDGGE